MNFPDQLLPSSLLWFSNATALLLLGLIAWRAPWWRLVKQGTLNVWLGMCVGVMLLWSVKTGIKPGLNFHLLGATLMTLMFGARLAMAGLAVVVAGVTLVGDAGWSTMGVNWLLTGVWPVSLSYLLYWLVDRKLPNHLFVYIFVNAFIGGGAVVVLTGLASTGLLILGEVYSSHYLLENYLPYYVLVGWSEAMMTGMAITLMTAFRPVWLSTFSDTRYLKTRPLSRD